MTTDNRYSHGKIYKLIDNTTGMFYIGSTALSRLDQRYHIHKQASNTSSYQNRKVYQYFTPERFASGDVEIIELVPVSVDTKRDLERIETDYI